MCSLPTTRCHSARTRGLFCFLLPTNSSKHILDTFQRRTRPLHSIHAPDDPYGFKHLIQLLLSSSHAFNTDEAAPPTLPPIVLRFHWATAGPGGVPGGGIMQLGDACRKTG